MQTSAPGTAVKRRKKCRKAVWKHTTICAVLSTRIPAASNTARCYLCSELTGPARGTSRSRCSTLPDSQQPWNRGGAQNLEGKVRTFTAPSWTLSLHRRDLTCLLAVYLGVCWRRYYCVLRAQPDVTAADAVWRKIGTFNQHGTLLKNVIKSHITLFQSAVYLHSSPSALSAYISFSPLNSFLSIIFHYCNFPCCFYILYFILFCFVLFFFFS